MIEEIRIRDLGVITDATLPLGPGLSVLTGETGAGKTMVVTALGMLLGGRSDSAAVRSGAKSAMAQAVVRLPEGHRAAELAEDAGGEVLEVEDALGAALPQELILSRTVNATGRSRATVGGAAAPIGTLAEIGGTLVAVHGQTDQLRLKSAQAQRQALDSYAGQELARLLDSYRTDYEEYRASAVELREVRENARARAFEAQSLSQALKEIDSVKPQEGEEESLDAESRRLSNIEQLRSAAGLAQGALVGGADADLDDATVAVLLDQAHRALDAEAADDQRLADLSQRVRELMILTTDVGEELTAYLSEIGQEGGGGRLAEVESRRAALKKLTRKYGADIPEVLQWAETNRARLEQLSDGPARAEVLEERMRALRDTMQQKAEEMTALRRNAARVLSDAVSEELTALAMPNASLVVEVEEAEKFGPDGKDTVSFRLAPHRGATPRPLGKGASGGELSRVMLALEVVLAEVDPVPTFIFDEVDAGVGGKAAVEIGKRLAMLAKHVQVLVVTHLPQVAAFADRHVLVLKSDDSTVSNVDVLDREGRIVELARMLAGHENSSAAREHAQELLQDAGQLGEGSGSSTRSEKN